MSTRQLIVGKQYGIYTLLDDTPIPREGTGRYWYKVRCTCGNTVERKRSQFSTKRCTCKPHRFVDIAIGQVYHQLTVIGDLVQVRYGKKQWPDYKVMCRCTCGVEKLIKAEGLLTGRTKSCGCYAKSLIGKVNRKHGLSTTSIYISWQKMMYRCQNPNDVNYPNYGERGIKVDPILQDFMEFYRLMSPTWAPGLTLDRIDVDGDYTLENLRWATPKEQANNRRCTLYTIDPFIGDRVTLKEFAFRYDLDYKALTRRHYQGHTGIDLVLFPKGYYMTKWPKLSPASKQAIYRAIDTSALKDAAFRHNLTLIDVLLIRYYR